MNKVLIIGAGAAGMMAAISAADEGYEVTVLEKNEKAGKKLFITGKGRCNITNATDVDGLIKNVIANPRFLYSAFNEFDSNAMMSFLEDEGLEIKVERGNRAFPVSDHSSDVIKTLKRAMDKRHVKVIYNKNVNHIKTDNDVFTSVICDDGEEIFADALIICTGGISYQSTGSTGAGYEFAKSAGHTVQECRPGLVPFIIKESFAKEISGLALKNVTLRLMVNGKKVYEELGEMLFTHFGISGPLVLTASEYYNNAVRKVIKKGDDIDAKVYVDLKPGLAEDRLDVRILKDFEASKNMLFKNSLGKLLPSSLQPVIVELSGIDPDKQVNAVNHEERIRLVKLLKNMPMTIESTRGFDEAIITSGGVNVKEINPKTMESKLVSNIYFAGEVIDADACTGGFNLQIAWSTGYLAGKTRH